MDARLTRYFRFLAPLAVIAVVAGLVVAFVPGRGSTGADRADDRHENSDSAIAFRNDMRKLWEDHVTWTRLVIISISDDLADVDPTLTRLLENQTHIGDAIKPYYGEAAGDQLTTLLEEHIQLAGEILVAAKSGDDAAQQDALDRWYANGDAIAAFLSSANPEHWPLQHMQDMMREHLDLTLEEAVARLTGDYAADIAAYDKVHVAILEMADMLSLGIIDQFPKQFR